MQFKLESFRCLPLSSHDPKHYSRVRQVMSDDGLPTVQVGTCTTHVEPPCSSSASAATEHSWMVATQLRLPCDSAFTPPVPIVASSATPSVWARLDSATCFPLRTQSGSLFSACEWGQRCSQPVAHWPVMGATHVWHLAALYGRLLTSSHPIHSSCLTIRTTPLGVERTADQHPALFHLGTYLIWPAAILVQPTLFP